MNESTLNAIIAAVGGIIAAIVQVIGSRPSNLRKIIQLIIVASAVCTGVWFIAEKINKPPLILSSGQPVDFSANERTFDTLGLKLTVSNWGNTTNKHGTTNQFITIQISNTKPSQAWVKTLYSYNSKSVNSEEIYAQGQYWVLTLRECNWNTPKGKENELGSLYPGSLVFAKVNISAKKNH